MAGKVFKVGPRSAFWDDDDAKDVVKRAGGEGAAGHVNGIARDLQTHFQRGNKPVNATYYFNC